MPPRRAMSFNKLRSIFFFTLITILSIAMVYLLRPFLYPIFWAAVIAVLFHPLYHWMKKYIPTGISLSITLIIVVVVLLIPLALLGTLLVNESVSLYQHVQIDDLRGALTTVEQWSAGTALAPYIEQAKMDWPTYAAQLTDTASRTAFTAAKNLTQNSLRFLFMLFIMLYTLYYFLRDGKRILTRLMHLSPLGDAYEKMLYKQFTSTARATLKNTLIVGGIQGTIGGIIFAISGIGGALIWGVIMVILAILPAIGPALVLIPAGMISLILGNVWAGVLLLVGALVVSFIDNLIRPPLLGKDIQMHPLVVLFSTLGGIYLFGVSGFVIGPVIAALYTSIMSIYEHYYEHELSNN